MNDAPVKAADRHAPVTKTGARPLGKPKAPTPPDPKETAAAQTSTNMSTAQANAILGNVNQVTPTGNLTYKQSGSQFVSDAGGDIWQLPGGGTGKGYFVPQYTATTTLSPNQQKLLNTGEQAQINLASLARDQSARIGSLLSRPLNTDFSADRKRVEDSILERMAPRMQADEEAQRARLNNQGVMAGSKAYERGIDEVSRSRNDARLGAVLAGGQEQSRLADLMFAARNQPINEITALMSGSQVTQPQFVNSNMPNIPTVDYAGLVQDNYQNKLGAYQQKNAQRQNMLGGLFGLGAAAIRGL